MLSEITPLIITLDEAPNILRVLSKLSWARRIVIVDSGSTDDTIQIAHRFPQVDVIARPFHDFASQCNFGLSEIRSPWVLSLDADYVLSDDLVEEIQNLEPSETVNGYQARFVYRIFGRSLRGSLYPPRTVLYRKDKAVYRNEGHGHRVAVQGAIRELKGVIFHEDHKPLSRWTSAQQRYARLEAEHLLSAKRENLSNIDKVRKLGFPAPLLVFLYTLFVKGCILDGWAGWHYVLQRLLAETLIALEVVDRRLRADRTISKNPIAGEIRE